MTTNKLFSIKELEEFLLSPPKTTNRFVLPVLQQLLDIMREADRLQNGLDEIYRWCFLDSMTRPDVSRRLAGMIESLQYPNKDSGSV